MVEEDHFMVELTDTLCARIVTLCASRHQFMREEDHFMVELTRGTLILIR